MANCVKNILLAREGTAQNQRFIDALDPASVKLNNFELKDWMKFAYDFAAKVNYFDIENDIVPAGNWQSFFKSDTELSSFLNDLETGSKMTPHLALFVAFIKLLEISKHRFNGLTKRHLDFYYQHVLTLEKQAASSDKVYAIFELARNAVSEKIATQTDLDGGKDADGKKRVYKTTNELVANQTKVALLKSVYNDYENSKFKAATIANSFDGNGADFPNDEVKWWPFAYYELGDESTREYKELADAKVGFAVAGEILEMQEGQRKVLLSLKLNTPLTTAISENDLIDNLEIYCTGKNGWLGPFAVIDKFVSLENTSTSSGSSADKYTVNIVFQVPKNEGALVKYDSKTHAENFKTDFPVCRVLFKTKEIAAHDLYLELLDKQISIFKIDVNVKGVKNVRLHNDVGAINVAKPFFPFGTKPVKNSKFYIDYAECYKKKWTKLSVNIEWKNTPDSFANCYKAYRNSFFVSLSPAAFKSGISDTSSENRIVTSDAYFTAEIEMDRKQVWDVLDKSKPLTLFHRNKDTGKCYSELLLTNDEPDNKNSSLRLSLNQSFLHELYPRLYAMAMSSDADNTIIPNEPYMPFVELLTFDYDASAEIEVAKYNTKDFDLYHEHPFGQSKECIDLKTTNDLLEDDFENLNLLPNYYDGGQMYIGLENVQPQQSVSLLIQVLEGSENPEVESFVGTQKVEWAVLCNNVWKNLDSTAIISNNTGNLLKSGILKFTMPKEITNNNTLLPSGYCWVKAQIHKKYNAVSKVIGIHAQALVAEFHNNANNLQHLVNGLPANTISKMVTRMPKVKGLTQPYSSFGGLPEETDTAYYRRISERLRHKNRAITIWDYEHLVLQQFPDIYKAKCLSHSCTSVINETRKTKYLAPGSVVLVVIPDIVNKNVFDIYQPRASKATLNAIQDYLGILNSKLVQTIVINPAYEELRIDCKVKFYKGFDTLYYKTVLKQDLTRLLSPWAFDHSASIPFGLSLHKSVIINYTEHLAYVDFVSDVKIYQKTTANYGEVEVNVAVPSCPEAILVSSKEHSVKDVENDCFDKDIESTEICQK